MAQRKSKYPEEMRIAIIQAIACFQPTKEIIPWVKAEWKIDLSPQYVEGHNPDRLQGRNLSKRWVEMFRSARKAYLDNVHAIPIANRAWRIQTYQSVVEMALQQRNSKMVMQALEQSAKEMGDQFTNKQIVTGIQGVLHPSQQPATVDDMEKALRKVRDAF